MYQTTGRPNDALLPQYPPPLSVTVLQQQLSSIVHSGKLPDS